MPDVFFTVYFYTQSYSCLAWPMTTIYFSLSTYAITCLFMKSSKVGSYHWLCCICFQCSFIVPILKQARIHWTQPNHSFSLSTFLSCVSCTWENTLRTSNAYTRSGDSDCTLLITLASSGLEWILRNDKWFRARRTAKKYISSQKGKEISKIYNTKCMLPRKVNIITPGQN